MKLIGMLDSPYVRRVAVSLQLLGLKFEHQSLSVFRGFADFQQINPVVKAPTLVCDDGEVLMDSTLILEYAEALARPRTLMPGTVKALQHELHLIGLALAATEKSVQLFYERALRPAEKFHEPWASRVAAQMLAAFAQLDGEISVPSGKLTASTIGQAGVTIAVAWHFANQVVPDAVPGGRFKNLATYSAAAEALPEFMAAPHGDGTYRSDG